MLDLRLVMVSHIDSDHITGIVGYAAGPGGETGGRAGSRATGSARSGTTASKTGGRPPAATQSSIVGASLGGVAPAGLDREVAAVVASVKQGNDLRGYAKKLATASTGRPTRELVMRTGAPGKEVIPLAAGLTFTVLGPREAELQALEDSWKAAKKTGGANEESVAADYLNRTVPNLSSIVVLAEATTAGGTRRLLLTGDAGGDLILEGLDTAGLLDGDGHIHVDLLKVQHHGSNHSVDIEFFRRVTAPRYVDLGQRPARHSAPRHARVVVRGARRAGIRRVPDESQRRKRPDRDVRRIPGRRGRKAAAPQLAFPRGRRAGHPGGPLTPPLV